MTRSAEETLSYLIDFPEPARRRVAARARARGLARHTADRRAVELEQFVAECR